MLFCIDIGNTHTVIGVYDLKDNKEKFINQFRITTDTSITSDELGIKLVQLMKYNDISLDENHDFIVSSVVPKIDYAIYQACLSYFKAKPMFVVPGFKSGIKIRLDDPKQLGADILVGAVSAVEKYGTNVLVIDMGTAMTIVYVNENKELLGGSIIPGMRTAYSGLFDKTAKLEAIGFSKPKNIIGTDTKTCLQSGMVYGWCSMLEGIVQKYRDELGNFKTIITGGEANMLEDFLKIDNYVHDDRLVLDGLKILYQKNKK